ncbi:hypothetical protein BS78_09G066900 [Paspalum vaginatum]|nr:hypothetical protein BS78_09G066900 [Paspalum vaginatum]KAJ1261935.1 hypothetical protein BS78_09G066900 [Paspalum vaginatum]
MCVGPLYILVVCTLHCVTHPSIFVLVNVPVGCVAAVASVPSPKYLSFACGNGSNREAPSSRLLVRRRGGEWRHRQRRRASEGRRRQTSPAARQAAAGTWCTEAHHPFSRLTGTQHPGRNRKKLEE